MNPALRIILLGAKQTIAKIISALFPSGSDGAAYDLSDFTTLWQQNTGLTQGGSGLPVGLLIDERQTIGVELATNTSITGNAANGSTQTYSTGAVVTAGKTYQISCDVTGYSGTGNVGFASNGLGATYFLAGNGHISGIKTATVSVPVVMVTGAANTANFSNISIKEVTGSHASQATAGSRPIDTAYGSSMGMLFDGIDDGLATAVGGGGTTGFFWCGAVKVVGGDGTSRSVWSDVGTNTGYRVRLASTNNLELGAGNGTAYTSATTTTSVLAGNTYILTVWDDGVNLNAQVNLGPIASTARPTVSAGTAAFSLAKDNNGSTAFANMALFEMFYKKNGSDVSAADRFKCQKFCAAKAGVSL
jgi:hypothetical protein